MPGHSAAVSSAGSDLESSTEGVQRVLPLVASDFILLALLALVLLWVLPSRVLRVLRARAPAPRQA